MLSSVAGVFPGLRGLERSAKGQFAAHSARRRRGRWSIVEPLDERVARRLRLDLEAQAADLEDEVAAQVAATRSLGDAVAEWARRGDVVRIRGWDWVVEGRVVHVGLDVVRLRTPTSDLDLRSEAMAEIEPVAGRRAPRVLAPGHPRTFIAACRELAAVRARISVRVGQREVDGTVLAVSDDHLVLTEPDRLVALASIVWVRRAA